MIGSRTAWSAALALALAACSSEARRAPTAAPAPAAIADARAPAAIADAAPRSAVLARPFVVGASVSAGFAAPRIADALKAALPGATVGDAASVMFFRDADRVGRRQIDAALAARPTVVVALDFLFWYAYQGGRAEDEASLERGLAELDRVVAAGVPVIVGDVPDMHGASPLMLPRSRIPPPDALAAMNARIAAWASSRELVVLAPMAAWAAPLRGHGQVALAPGEAPVPADSLMAPDGLHPNALGLWYLLDHVNQVLAARFPGAAFHVARPAPKP